MCNVKTTFEDDLSINYTTFEDDLNTIKTTFRDGVVQEKTPLKFNGFKL